MVDEARLARLLGSIDERLDRLQSLPERLGAGGADVTDEIVLDAAKYLLIAAVEGVVAVAHHLVSSERLGVPDTNAEAIRLLGEHGVIPSDLAASLAEAAGFRNILVHQYARVDDQIVLDALNRLEELDAFVAAVGRWATGHGPGRESGVDRTTPPQA